MDTITWVAQILLALTFLASGANHAFRFDAAAKGQMSWMLAVGRDRMRVIGILEILGALGLVLPTATGILPWLTPLAALGLALIMLGAAVFHLRRQGEVVNAVFNAVIGLLAAGVAIAVVVVA
jgi:uncharacterized membrane protein YphA (DoxX/SURF4 family)